VPISTVMTPNPGAQDGVSPLEALLELSRSASEDPLPRVLSTVANTVRRTAGFASVVLNIYRPAWDDYEAVLVVGQDDGINALAGTTVPRETFEPLLNAPQRQPGVFFLAAESRFWESIEHTFTPELSPTDEPGAWQADDGLLVFLSDSDGQPLAFVSVDEPVSCHRPTDDELRLLRAICSHAEHSLENARRGGRTEESRRMLSLLLETSPALSACTTTSELLELAGQTVVPQLGFERFAAYWSDGGPLRLCATRGWEDEAMLAPAFDPDRLAALLTPEREHAGCFLLEAGDLLSSAQHPPQARSASAQHPPQARSASAQHPPQARSAMAQHQPQERSARNGRGAAAWHDHCLLVPLRCDGLQLRGLIAIEDPVDRLLPNDERRRIVRLLVDQVTAAQESIDHRARLNHLASHDPLTGVRNRRGLDDTLSAQDDVALLVCDIDYFKQVNDRYGHELGDRVLARFGGLLRELARESDIPIRMGGEEFCVVMPKTDRHGAMRAAERLRAETSRRLVDLVPDGITVSIGVAAASSGMDSHALMAAADEGLYVAKASGRNRTVYFSGT
jgi:diguanylate cyclase (GGDEF)-like protein